MYGFVGVFSGVKGEDHEGGALSLETVFDGFDPVGEHDGFGCEAIGGFDFKGGFGRRVEADRYIFNDTGVLAIFNFRHGTETLHELQAYSVLSDPFGRFRRVHVE